MNSILRFTVLAAAALAACLKVGPANADSKEPQTCAGYPPLSATDLGSAPRDKTLEQVDVNSDGLVDLIAVYPEGGSGLYINCGNGRYYRAVWSATRIQARPAKEDGWAPLFIAWQGDRSTRIDGQLYRPDLLPFSSKAPVDFLIEHDGGRYALPFDNCKALGLHAPVYRFERQPDGSGNNPEEVSALYLELTAARFPLAAEMQDAYVFGRLYFTDFNEDGAPDAVLHYEERLGSGREAFGALLLNCGDDRFVASGSVGFGAVNEAYPRLHSGKMSICGAPFTTVVVERLGQRDITRPQRRPRIDYDLYLYRPILKDFMPIASAPDPRQSTFERKIKGRCADILKRAYILRK